MGWAQSLTGIMLVLASVFVPSYVLSLVTNRLFPSLWPDVLGGAFFLVALFAWLFLFFGVVGAVLIELSRRG